MARVRFCPMCQKPVTPKKCNKLIMIILLIIGIVPGILYYIFCGGSKCPMCNSKI